MRRRMMKKRPDMTLVEVDAIKRDDAKADIYFKGHYLAKNIRHADFEIKQCGLIWSTKQHVELVIDGKLNPDLKPTYASGINNYGRFNIYIRSLPEGMVVRGKMFAKLEDKDGNDIYFFSKEKRGYNLTPTKLAAGLYDDDYNLICLWRDLVNDYGLDISKDYTKETYLSDVSSLYNVIKNNEKLQKGTILLLYDNVTKIGNHAFRECDTLRDIRLPDSVTELGTHAFINCDGLKEIKMSSAITGYPMSLFYGSGIEEIVIPDTVTALGEYMFAYCKNLKTVTFHPNIKKIGARFMFSMRESNYSLKTLDMSMLDFADVSSTYCMFQYQQGLQDIKFPKNFVVSAYTFNHMNAFNCKEEFFIPSDWRLEYETNGHYFYDIGKGKIKRFVVEEGNQYFKEINGVLYTKDGTTMLCCPNVPFENRTFYIEEGVTKLTNMSFTKNNTIDTLVLPNSLDIYGAKDRPSPNETYLRSAIHIYTTICKYDVKEDNPYYSAHEGVLYSKDYKILHAVPTRYKGVINVKEGCETIWWELASFNYSPSEQDVITEIRIPKTVTSMVSDAVIARINQFKALKTVDPENPVSTVVNNKIVRKA